MTGVVVVANGVLRAGVRAGNAAMRDRRLNMMVVVCRELLSVEEKRGEEW